MPTDSVIEPLAYSRREAASALNVPVSQVDAAIARGELPHFRIGKHVRVPAHAVDRLVGRTPSAGLADDLFALVRVLAEQAPPLSEGQRLRILSILGEAGAQQKDAA
ncbi:excisionase family DNA-binding protein [Pseudonocardia sp. WMMC193]|uniref:excisionase family DNA-binding protein n=1 Tax=Pseudonocardia sp. WMMC193 TaxID=2911965 RepID=UPI001F01F09D|nr:excisionase family DNA-binding protein [Pseudonocardia sp. WMMC193]MCF7548918.1 excisionase family DNA-binding protein [Pseudonocardia sp. WMMC193]